LSQRREIELDASFGATVRTDPSLSENDVFSIGIESNILCAMDIECTTPAEDINDG